jgi:predicted Zn-dependent peptidase
MDFKLLSKKAASMGGSINVSVGVEQVTIGGSVLSEFAAEFISMISDMAMNPAFPASELERIKNGYETRPGGSERCTTEYR